MRESHVPCVQTESCVDMSKRNVQLHFRVSEKEADVIKKKMEESGIKSIGAYLRKMAVDKKMNKRDWGYATTSRSR